MPSHRNPIEQAFPKAEGILRRGEARAREALIEATGAALRAVGARDAGGFFRTCGHRTPDQLPWKTLQNTYFRGNSARVPFGSRLGANLEPRAVRIGAIGLTDPLGANLGEILARNGITVGNLGKRRAFDPRAFVRVARVLERFRFQVVHTPTDAVRFILSPPLRRGMAHASR